MTPSNASNKNLVHLIRDINDDIRKEPFNEEMKEMANAFGALLRAIVATVDRFGLKAHHLRKHKPAAEGFYDAFTGRIYETEMAARWKDRFQKNRKRLFTFLDHDGVPWNNNNAEHAVKRVVMLRNVIGGTSSPKGTCEYLTLLTIAETCKYKGIGFLDFLRSQELDLDAFVALRCRRIQRR
jgi:hypothetical protein